MASVACRDRTQLQPLHISSSSCCMPWASLLCYAKPSWAKFEVKCHNMRTLCHNMRTLCHHGAVPHATQLACCLAFHQVTSQPGAFLHTKEVKSCACARAKACCCSCTSRTHYSEASPCMPPKPPTHAHTGKINLIMPQRHAADSCTCALSIQCL
jgi:hypothetical protein